MFLILANEAYQFATLFDLIQRFDKLICEILDPLNVLVFDFDEGIANTFFPFTDDADIWLVFLDGFRGVCFDRLKFF